MISDKDSYETPPALFWWAQDYFGCHLPFTLDAAASDENTRCDRYITSAYNALAQPWLSQRVWCNPPYSKKAGPILKWVEYAFGQVRAYNNAENVTMLIPADTSTEYFRFTMHHAKHICFLKRVRFVGADDDAKFGSMLIEFARDQDRYKPSITTCDIPWR